MAIPVYFRKKNAVSNEALFQEINYPIGILEADDETAAEDSIRTKSNYGSSKQNNAEIISIIN